MSSLTSKSNDIEMINGTIDDLKQLYSRFERDFPENERKTMDHLQMLMLKGHYKLLLAKHKILEGIIGYALLLTLDDPKVLWLDYIAIEDQYQNLGYGTLLFKKIIECEGPGKRGMFIEVEIPQANNIDQLRRVRFYDRLGAKCLSNAYKLPTLEGGLEMSLYYKAIAKDKILPADIIKKATASTFDYIHTDIPNREAILKSFMTTIKSSYPISDLLQ